jgi:cell division protein FtsI/penicillin-binding protein 2
MRKMGIGFVRVDIVWASHVVKCHGSHGIPDVQTALQYSCNSYFCKIYNDFIMDSTFAFTGKRISKWWDMTSQFGIW